MCKQYIELHYADIAEKEITVFEDEGFSGKNLKRPQFQAMMTQEKRKPFDYIVVYRLDRISRNVGDFASLIEQLNECHTSFICIKEQFDTSTPMGRAMMNIAAVFAQLERETIAERIKDNMYMLAKEGKWTGGQTPLGYKSIQHTSCDASGKEHSFFTLTIDETQIDLVRLIFEKYSEFHSAHAVEMYLFEHNFKTQRNNYWDSGNIKRVLTNPTYCIADEASYKYFSDMGCCVCFTPEDCDGKSGILAYNRYCGAKRQLTTPDKWVITKSTHEGILTGEEFVRIQGIVAEKSYDMTNGKKAAHRVSHNSRNLLSGTLYCTCGAYMRPKVYPSGNMYYICESKLDSKKAKCQMKSVNGDELDKTVVDELYGFDLEESIILKQLNMLRKKVGDIDENISAEVKALQAKIDNNERAIENLISVLSMNPSPQLVELTNQHISELSAENHQLSLELIELQDKEAQQEYCRTELSALEKTLQDFREKFHTQSIENKREYIKKIIDRIVWDGEEAHIFIKGEE